MTYVEDLPPGATARQVGTQDDYDAAVGEIRSNQLELGALVGITAEDIAGIDEDERRIAEIDAVQPAAEKLVEMLRETRADTEHRRHRRIADLAALIDARIRARDDEQLLARYEKTRKYRSAIANKAAATRKRNQNNQ